MGTTSVVAPVSCRLTEEGIEIIPADTIAPTVEQFQLSASNSVVLVCSEQIALGNISVFEADSDSVATILEADSLDSPAFAVADTITYSEDGLSAEILLSAATAVGKSYVFSGTVYDRNGNTLDFRQKFTGYNANPAVLLFNEIRTSYEKKTQKTEFVEFYVLKEGNTSGLEFVSATSGIYEFPSIEVKRGEYITLHGRTLFAATSSAAEIKIENYADELDARLSLSKTPDSYDSARDLWKEGSDKIAATFDVLVLRDSNTKILKDAVLLSTSSKTEWAKNKKLMKEFAEQAFECGIWTTGANPENAVFTNNLTVTRSISRKNTAELARRFSSSSENSACIASSAADWIIAQSATPGYENCMTPYVKK